MYINIRIQQLWLMVYSNLFIFISKLADWNKTNNKLYTNKKGMQYIILFIRRCQSSNLDFMASHQNI